MSSLIAAPSLLVRLVPELCQAALKLKQHKELAVWYCLRSINNWGSGRLTQKQAIASLSELFNYSVSSAYDILSKGDGLYWDCRIEKQGSVVEIRGLARVARDLGITYLSRFHDVPASQFNSLQWRNAWLFSVFYDPEGKARTNPISRQSVEEATGVMPRTQQRYENLIGVQKRPNYAFTQVGEQYVPVKTEVISVCKGKSRVSTIQKQFGNTYQCPVVRTVKGMCRKIRSAIRSCEGDEALTAQRFFYSATKLIKTTDRDTESYLAIPDKHCRMPRAVRGEWCVV